MVVLSVTGVYGAVSLTADFGRGEGGQLYETRYVLGMGHPNALHCMLWMLAVLAVYSYADRLKWYHSIPLHAATKAITLTVSSLSLTRYATDMIPPNSSMHIMRID